jgi:hypothetical protein
MNFPIAIPGRSGPQNTTAGVSHPWTCIETLVGEVEITSHSQLRYLPTSPPTSLHSLFKLFTQRILVPKASIPHATYLLRYRLPVGVDKLYPLGQARSHIQGVKMGLQGSSRHSKCKVIPVLN